MQKQKFKSAESTSVVISNWMVLSDLFLKILDGDNPGIFDGWPVFLDRLGLMNQKILMFGIAVRIRSENK